MMIDCNSQKYSFHIYTDFELEHSEQDEKSYLHDSVPDYSFEIITLSSDEENRSVSLLTNNEFNSLIDNYGITESAFFNLNFGDLLVMFLNQYENPNFLLDKFMYYQNNYKINRDKLEKLTKTDNKSKNENKIIEVAMKLISIQNDLVFILPILKCVEPECSTGLLAESLIKLESRGIIHASSLKCRLDTLVPTFTASIRPNSFSAEPDYYFQFPYEALYFELYQVAKNGINIKRCSNCGKFFVPLMRSNEIYCDNEFKDGKTCKQLGYEMKIQKDEYLKLYRTAYKTQHARMKRNLTNKPDYKEKVFDVWVSEAKAKLSDAQAGRITLEEFHEFLNSKSGKKV